MINKENWKFIAWNHPIVCSIYLVACSVCCACWRVILPSTTRAIFLLNPFFTWNMMFTLSDVIFFPLLHTLLGRLVIWPTSSHFGETVWKQFSSAVLCSVSNTSTVAWGKDSCQWIPAPVSCGNHVILERLSGLGIMTPMVKSCSALMFDMVPLSKASRQQKMYLLALPDCMPFWGFCEAFHPGSVSSEYLDAPLFAILLFIFSFVTVLPPPPPTPLSLSFVGNAVKYSV